MEDTFQKMARRHQGAKKRINEIYDELQIIVPNPSLQDFEANIES